MLILEYFFDFFSFLDTTCRLYSVIVSDFYVEEASPTTELDAFKCYSSWSNHNDVAQLSTVIGTAYGTVNYGFEQTNEGFLCPVYNSHQYQAKKIAYPWLRFDLQDTKVLECVRVAVCYPKINLQNTEFRFGNFSTIFDFDSNVYLGDSGNPVDSIIEFCPEDDIKGRYLFMRRSTSVGLMDVGEVQITVKNVN